MRTAVSESSTHECMHASQTWAAIQARHITKLSTFTVKLCESRVVLSSMRMFHYSEAKDKEVGQWNRGLSAVDT